LSSSGALAAVAFAAGDAVVRVYRLSDGALLRELVSAGPGSSPAVALSPDGALVALGAKSAQARFGLWRVSDGAPLLELDAVVGRPAFSQAGDQILVLAPAAGSDVLTAQLRTVAGGKLARDFGPADAFGLGDDDRAVIFHDRKVTTFAAGDSGPGISRAVPLDLSVSISPRADIVYGLRRAGTRFTVESYRVADGVRLWAGPAVPVGVQLVMSPDQRRLLVSGEAGLAAFDVDSGTAVPAGDPGDLVAPHDVALGPGDSPVLIAAADGVHRGHLGQGDIRLWELGTGQGQPIISLAISGDGRRLATGSMGPGPNVLVWDLGSRQWERTIPETSTTASVAFSPEGDRVLRALYDVEEWRLEGARPAATFAVRGTAWTAAYAPGGAEIAVSLLDSDVVVLLARAGGAVRSTLQTRRSPASMAFSPDGLSIATAGPALWRVSDGGLIWPGSPPQSGIEPARGSIGLDPWVTFSPGGTLIAVSEFGTDPGVSAPWLAEDSGRDLYRTSTKIYRARDGAIVKDLGNVGRRPAFSPDEAWVAAAGSAYDVMSTSGGTEVLDRRSGGVSTFAPNGTIAVGASDGIVRLYCPQ
jgi:WD40 repeat protein